MTEIIMGIFGLFLIICAVFDVEWIMNLTRAARQGYPMGKTLTRVLMGFFGLALFLNGIADAACWVGLCY